MSRVDYLSEGFNSVLVGQHPEIAHLLHSVVDIHLLHRREVLLELFSLLYGKRLDRLKFALNRRYFAT